MARVRPTLLVVIVGTLALGLMGSLGSIGAQTKPSSKNPTKQADLERSFKDMLTGATMVGTWRMTPKGGLAADAPLGESRVEKYTIVAVDKSLEDHWVIQARIEFGDQDATIPVSVRVVWAGDTPVITVDDFRFPGMGPYAARVMVYRNFYAGTWFGPDYGGVLSGRIVPTKEPDASKSPDGDS